MDKFFEVREGKVIWYFPKLSDWYYKVSERKRIRSPASNRLYWGFILKYIVLAYRDSWYVHTKDYIHKKFKDCFLETWKEYDDYNPDKFINKEPTTATLNNKQFKDYIDSIKIICEFGKLWEIPWMETLEPFVIPEITEGELLEWIDKNI